MTISINNQQRDILNTTSIDHLLQEMEIPSRGIAIALNNTVISKENWKNTFLNEKDQLTIIQATQGG